MTAPYTVTLWQPVSGPGLCIKGADGRRWIAKERRAAEIIEDYGVIWPGQVHAYATVDPDGTLHLGEPVDLPGAGHRGIFDA